MPFKKKKKRRLKKSRKPDIYTINPLLTEDNLLTDGLKETIVKIANRVQRDKSIRKTNLIKIMGKSTATFTKAIRFLVKMNAIRVVTKYPPDVKTNNSRGHKYVYLEWNSYVDTEAVTSISNLIKYKETDLSKYPIVELDKHTTEQKVMLKKFLFRMERKGTKFSTLCRDRIFSLVMPDHPSPAATIYLLVRMPTNTYYGTLKKMFERKQLEVYITRDKSSHKDRVMLVKNWDWIEDHTQWICENCKKKNSGASLYCGACGMER